MWQQLLADLNKGEIKVLARSISFIENEVPGHEEFLQSLPNNNKAKVVGVTGPPGAGKSTLVDGLIKQFVEEQYKIAVLCIDPSSPFNHGAILGDRIRMNKWYNHPDVFIRSLATRGSMGGLTNKILETTEIVKAAGFDYIIIETAGVGQTEIEIAGLADTTVVVLVPEAGDEVQAMKSGLMEIADVFVINKSDRPAADEFENNLKAMLAHSANNSHIPVIKSIATEQAGMPDLYQLIKMHDSNIKNDQQRYKLLSEKAYYLIRQKRMKDISKDQLMQIIQAEANSPNFNVYKLVNQFLA